MNAAKRDAKYFIQKPHIRSILVKNAMPVAALNLNLAFDEEESVQQPDYLKLSKKNSQAKYETNIPVNPMTAMLKKDDFLWQQ